SSRRRHTRWPRDWSSDVCSSDLINAMGRAMLVYLATRPWTDDFRSFLAGHLPLLDVTPTWTLRIVFPPSLQRVVTEYQRAVYERSEERRVGKECGSGRWTYR